MCHVSFGGLLFHFFWEDEEPKSHCLALYSHPSLIPKKPKYSAVHLHSLPHPSLTEGRANSPHSPQVLSLYWECSVGLYFSHKLSPVLPNSMQLSISAGPFFRCSESEVDPMQLLLCQEPATACFTVDVAAMCFTRPIAHSGEYSCSANYYFSFWQSSGVTVNL